MNPIDWIAWLYGRFFLRHTYIGGAVLCSLAAVTMLLLYVRAVDKYNEEHKKPPPAVATASEPPTAPPSSAPARGEVNVQRRDTRPASSLGGSYRKPSSQVPLVQNAPGGINISGGNVTNPTVNNYASPDRTLDDRRREAFVRVLSAHPHGSIMVYPAGTSEDVPELTKQLIEASKAAGWIVPMSGGTVMINGENPFTANGIECYSDDWEGQISRGFKLAAEAAGLPCKYVSPSFSKSGMHVGSNVQVLVGKKAGGSPPSQTSQTMVLNQGTISNSRIQNNTIFGASQNHDQTLLRVDPGAVMDGGTVEGVSICNLNGWSTFLDCIDLRSGQPFLLGELSDTYERHMNEELQASHISAERRGQCHDAIHAALAELKTNANNVHQTVKKLRLRRPFCAVP